MPPQMPAALGASAPNFREDMSTSDVVMREELDRASRKIQDMQENYEHQERELSKVIRAPQT